MEKNLNPYEITHTLSPFYVKNRYDIVGAETFSCSGEITTTFQERNEVFFTCTRFLGGLESDIHRHRHLHT